MGQVYKIKRKAFKNPNVKENRTSHEENNLCKQFLNADT